MAELQGKGSDLKRRVIGYGTSAVLVGGLLYAGFIYEADPDPFTLMGSVDIQLRLAAGMPAEDKDGNPVGARVDLLQQANQNLDRIRQSHPHWAPVYEYSGFLAYLEGRYLDAAGLYREVRGKEDCSDDMRDKAIINEARMLRMAGEVEQACALLRDSQKNLLEANVVIARDELAKAEASMSGQVEPQTTESATPDGR